MDWKYSLYVAIWTRTSERHGIEVGRMMNRRRMAKEKGMTENTDEWTMKQWYERVEGARAKK